jgi:benzoylformate decarboxylase
MRAYAEALQPPAGPVYLSIPMDDWKRPLSGFTRVRTVSDRVAPDSQRLRLFADRISASRRPAAGVPRRRWASRSATGTGASNGR